MNLLLTDRLACPRCGPQFGLILLAEDLQERRVLEGHLGCANCRQRYPVKNGFADLRPVGHSSEDTDSKGLTAAGASEERTVQVAALVGVREGPAQVLLLGGVGRFAVALSRIVTGVDWIASHPGTEEWDETEGVDRIQVHGTLPFYDRVLRAVVCEGVGSVSLEEMCRVVQSGGRVVLFDAQPEARAEFEASGFDIVFESGQVLVGARP